jgi:hypothetical protein
MAHRLRIIERQMMQNRNGYSRFAWALASTLSSSCSTLLALLLFRKSGAATDFVHLYSTVAMTSACINSYIFLGGTFCLPARLRLQGVVAALCAGIISFTLLFLLFRFVPTLSQAGFTITYLIPILFAPAYRTAFRHLEFARAYGRTIILNAAYLCGAIAGLLAGDPEVIYPATALILPFAAAAWILDPFFLSGDSTLESKEDARHLANPSIILLERTMYDQTALIQGGVPGFTWLYYLASRGISFVGTVFFTFSTESAMSRTGKGGGHLWSILWGLVACCALLMAIATWSHLDLKWILVLSQFCGWALCNQAISEFDAKRGYWKIMAFASLDAVLRWVSLQLFAGDGENLARALLLFIFLLSIVRLGSRNSIRSIPAFRKVE